jgi:phosphoglycolate phosphatase-like HAD superfamily hydrolase
VTEVMMVGDGPQDVLAGRHAGAFTVGVRGGIQAEERLLAAEPHVVIDTLAELAAVLNQLASGTPR